MGEMALMFRDVYDLTGDLQVIPMSGWLRKMLWYETGLTWTMPSPNMPFPETAWVYPGQVIWEGTNISEGRGTARPFEIFGAPFLRPKAILEGVRPDYMKGCRLQVFSFRPTFHKWKGACCRGFLIHILDAALYRPYVTSLALLREVIARNGSSFQWAKGPYEYEYDRTPIDLILGDPSVRNALEKGVPMKEIVEKWQDRLEEYRGWRKSYLLYGARM